MKIQNLLKIKTIERDGQHFYKIGKHEYESVTTALKAYIEPDFVKWRIKTCVDNLDIYASDNELQRYADIGTRIHNSREELFKNNEYQETDEEIQDAFTQYKIWLNSSGFIPMYCELPLYSHRLKLAGRIDDIGYLNDKLVMIDLKTTSYVNKTSYYMQQALYYIMAKEHGIPLEECYLLSLNRNGKTRAKLTKINNIDEVAKLTLQALKGLRAIKKISISQKQLIETIQ